MTGNVLPTKILVQPEEEKETKTSSGIILANITKKPNISGVVRLCGSGMDSVPMPVKEGQTVLFYHRSAQPVTIGDEELLLLDVRDVLYFF